MFCGALDVQNGAPSKEDLRSCSKVSIKRVSIKSEITDGDAASTHSRSPTHDDPAARRGSLIMQLKSKTVRKLGATPKRKSAIELIPDARDETAAQFIA